MATTGIGRRTEERVIEGCTYSVSQLGAIKGSQVLVRVVKMLGPAFVEKNPARLFDGVTEEDVKYLVDTFAPLTMVDGVVLGQVFDLHFAGRYTAMFQWLWFCLQLNYGDFLKGGAAQTMLGSVGGAALQVSQSTSQSTPTGQSGAS